MHEGVEYDVCDRKILIDHGTMDSFVNGDSINTRNSRITSLPPEAMGAGHDKGLWHGTLLRKTYRKLESCFLFHLRLDL